MATRPITKTSPADFPSMPTAETQLIARPRSLVSVFLSDTVFSLLLLDRAHKGKPIPMPGPTARPLAFSRPKTRGSPLLPTAVFYMEKILVLLRRV